MSQMTGQLDLLDLLAPEEMTAAEKVAKWGYPYTIPGTGAIPWLRPMLAKYELEEGR